LVSQANITGFPKTGIFNTTIIILVFLGKNNAIVGFIIRINRVFATGTRGYFGTHIIYAKSKIDLFRIFAGMLGGYNKKEGRTWGFSNISYMILKRRDDTSREGNSVTNTHVTRGP
jgi:hypothetical protein